MSIEQDLKTEERATMRAVILSGFGGLKTLRVLSSDEPTLEPGQILLRTKACGLNFQDLMVRQGVIDSLPKTPFVMGFECAGQVERLGEGVDSFKVGDRVVALPEYNGWAELVAVPQQFVYPIPPQMSFHDAAAVAMNYAVAYILLFEIGCLTPGKTVLLHSAGGGVGHAVVQLCRTVEDVKVIGVASKCKHEILASSIDHLIERGSDYTNQVRKYAGMRMHVIEADLSGMNMMLPCLVLYTYLYPCRISAEGVDLVLDCLCGEESNRGYALLKPMGKYILFGSANVVTGETKSLFSAARAWWQVDKLSPIKLFEDNKTIGGLNLKHLLYQQNGAEYISSIIKKILELWSEGKIKPVIDSTWALEDVPEAMQKMHDRKNIGKILLDPSLQPKPKPSTPAKTVKPKSNDKDEKKKEDEEIEDKGTDESETGEKKSTS